MSSEGDTGVGVKTGSIIEHDGQTSHAEDSIINFDFSDDSVSMLFPELGKFFLAGGNDFLFEYVSEIASREEPS